MIEATALIVRRPYNQKVKFCRLVMMAKKSFHILKVGTPRIQENDTRTLGFLTLSIYGVPNKRYFKKIFKKSQKLRFSKVGSDSESSWCEETEYHNIKNTRYDSFWIKERIVKNIGKKLRDLRLD